MATISANLPQPIDYSIDVKMPFEAALEGFKLGSDVATIQAAQQKRLLEQQAMQQAQTRQAELGTRLKSFYNKKPEERNFEEIEQLFALAGNKDQLDALKLMAEGTDKRRLDTEKRFYAQVMLGLESEPTVAFKLLDDKILAEKDPAQKAALQTIKRTAETVNPAAAVNLIEPYTASIFGKDWYAGLKDARVERRAQDIAPSALQKSVADADKAVADKEKAVLEAKDTPDRLIAEKELREAQAKKATAEAQQAAVKAKYEESERLAALDKINWDVKNLKSQINDRVAKLNLDKQTTQATVAEKLSAIQQRLTDIPEGARKLINESATLAATSKQAATQYNDLASRIESADGGLGKLTSVSQWLRTNTGQQDAWTQIRNEYTRVRNSVAIKALPPGVATDKDIELALKGIPPETANAATIASFLRGTAKLQDIDSSINNAKTDWLSQNNGLLTRAKGTFIAGDYAAKAGESFNDFAQRIVGDVASKYRSPAQVAEDTRQKLISQIPTNQTPAAAPQQTSIEAQADAILRGGR